MIDPVWDTTDSAANFIQFQPYNGKEPSRPTIAKVLTTESALYCLMVCKEDKGSIQLNTGKLDDGGNSDIVSIMLDTFRDNQTAYKFGVTAAGVRTDCRLLDDARNRDYSWDGVWFAASKVYDWGFVVEMEIPYRSIQYDENLNEWGLDFDRWVPARNEDIYWCPYEQNEGQRILKFGKLLFTDYRPSVKGLNLEVYPVGISKATYLEGGKYKFEPDAGIDIFYNPSQKLTYQLTANPDFALAMGTKIKKENWFTGIRGNWIGKDFDISQVGYVPWKGTAEFVGFSGPRWFFEQGSVMQILLYIGPMLYYERIDGYTDYAGLIGFNMNFRPNWGFEINYNTGKSKDQGIEYQSYQANISSWFNTAKLNGNVYGGYTKTYNFSRSYLSFYSWAGCFVEWQAGSRVQLGSSFDMYIEGNPDNDIEDVTINSRPYVSVTPINDLSVRIYFDNVYVRSTQHLEHVIVGFLFSYNFLPKSWIYFALNEVQDRSNEYDSVGNQLPNRMHTTSRAGVLKVKYLYYF